MNTTSNTIIDNFNDCWIKALLYHVLTKEDILTITRTFGAVSAKNENKISKHSLIELIFFKIKKDELIEALQSLVRAKGMPDHYAYLGGMFQKINELDPVRVADIYLHLSSTDHKDMAMKVFSGEELHRVFTSELTTLIFRELLLDNDRKLTEIFEYSVAKHHLVT